MAGNDAKRKKSSRERGDIDFFSHLRADFQFKEFLKKTVEFTRFYSFLLTDSLPRIGLLIVTIFGVGPS